MDTKPKSEGIGPGHETRDTNIRALVYFGVGLFLTLAAALLLMVQVFSYFEASQSLGPPASPFENVRVLPPPGQPRLQVNPQADLARLSGDQEKILSSYAWVDEKAGIARIPIDRAIELTLEKRLPVRGTAPGDAGIPATSTGRNKKRK